MKRSATQSDVLGNLVAERQKFEQWIAALEEKKGSTPPKVYERVHADYTSRLASVMEELGARSVELESQRASLQERSDDLSAQESALRDERAEAELRNMVGEYSSQQWKELSKASDADIAKLAAERGTIDAELASLNKILDGMGGGKSAKGAGASAQTQSESAASAPKPADATKPAESAKSAESAKPAEAAKTTESAIPVAEGATEAAAAQPSVAATPAASTPSSASSGSSSASAAGGTPSSARPTPAAGTAGASPPPRAATPSRSVAGTPLGFPASSSAPPSNAASSERAAASGPRSMPATPLETPSESSPAAGTRPHRPSFDELAFLKSVAPGSPRDNAVPPSNNSVEGGEPKGRAAAEGASQSPVAPLRPTRQVNAADVGAVGIENLSSAKNETPAFLKNVPSEQTKTLKCGECSAMNYATEWYCERCGAELSAL